jgi:hypothetical protein
LHIFLSNNSQQLDLATGNFAYSTIRNHLLQTVDDNPKVLNTNQQQRIYPENQTNARYQINMILEKMQQMIPQRNQQTASVCLSKTERDSYLIFI